MLITILATILVLGVLIFVHELGHFITAKLVDIEVPRFSIGLGPKLWGFRRGETEYVISWLPLGGYVKMAGMEEMEQVEGGPVEKEHGTGLHPPLDGGLTSEAPRAAGPRDFESKSLGARALVISAGVIMNTLFAFLMFMLMGFVWGIRQMPEARIASVDRELLPPGTEALASVPQNARVVAWGDRDIDDWGDLSRAIDLSTPGPVTVRFDQAAPVTLNLPREDTVRIRLQDAIEPHLPARIGSVTAGGAAAAAGLREGDLVVEADGVAIGSWRELVDAIEASEGRTVQLVVVRNAQRVPLEVTPEMVRDVNAPEAPAQPRIGIGSDYQRVRPGPLEGIAHGARQTWFWISATFQFLGQLFSGDQSPRNLGGPILIGQVSGQVARAGFEAFAGWMAVLSINLAVLNLLPIPVLDGGHLVFLLVEAVRGRALSIEQRMRLTQLGFVVVLAIMVWALANDVLRLFGV